MIIHHLHIKNYEIQLFLKNPNFTYISSQQIKIETNLNYEQIKLLFNFKNNFYELIKTKNNFYLKFKFYLKYSENEIQKMKILKNESFKKEITNKFFRIKIKKLLPTIFDKKEIKNLNFYFYVKFNFKNLILNCLNEIFCDEEILNEIKRKNKFLEVDNLNIESEDRKNFDE